MSQCEHHDYTMVEDYILGLQWSPAATDHEKSLVAGNIRGFYEHMRKSTLSQPIEPQGAVVTDAMMERAMNAWCDVADVDEWRVRNTPEALRAALEAALPVAVGAGEAVVWVDPYELMMVREHGGMIVATHEAEPESKRTQPLYMTPATPAGKGK